MRDPITIGSPLAIVPSLLAFAFSYYAIFSFLAHVSVLVLDSLFFSLFNWCSSLKDVAFLAGFTAFHEGFMLPLTDPPIFKWMAYQAFVEIWRFLTSCAPLELFWDRRELALSHLHALRRFGFTGSWFKDLSCILQRLIPMSVFEESEKLTSEASASETWIAELQQEPSALSLQLDGLSKQLDVVNSELKAETVVFNGLIDYQKAIEETRKTFDAPLSL